MNKIMKIGIVMALVVIVTALLVAKQIKTAPEATITNNSDQNMAQPSASPASATETAENPRSAKALPRLVDLGADKCIPCKLMAPILEELKQEYAGRLQVDFIDVWKNPDAGEEYDIKLIPTQIFYDVSGKELFRHEGFFSKEDILAKWEGLGINFEKEQIQ